VCVGIRETGAHVQRTIVSCHKHRAADPDSQWDCDRLPSLHDGTDQFCDGKWQR
jgi:hypothetical protein